MAKYYVPFVNINTFIYEPTIIEEPSPYDVGNRSALIANAELALPNNRMFQTIKYYGEEDISELGESSPQAASVQKNTLGVSPLGIFVSLNSDVYKQYANKLFFEFEGELPTTASFFTALNLKRNGPYGYCSWRQIRVGDNPLIRNQKKKNILTFTRGDLKKNLNNTNQNFDPSDVEYFIEPAFSNRENPIALYFQNDKTIKKKYLKSSRRVVYFDSSRLNRLYAPIQSPYELTTNLEFVNSMIEEYKETRSQSSNSPFRIEYSRAIYPNKKNLSYDSRIRKLFYFPWKDNAEERYQEDAYPYALGKHLVDNIPFNPIVGYPAFSSDGSIWPLDGMDPSSGRTDRNPNFPLISSFGILQHDLMYGSFASPLSQLSNLRSAYVQCHPLYSYKHIITPLTSCVSPYGMFIEGINSGSSFADLSTDHIPSGEATWDAASQYGVGPFYNSYSSYIDDIKKVGKDSTVISEFRSSLHFEDLQDAPDTTPLDFLRITGSNPVKTTYDTTTASPFYVSSSQQSADFFEVYGHSDFLQNFDVAQEVSKVENKLLYNITLKCKAIKKFIPYNGFYPAQRTVQIAEKFATSVHPNADYSSSFGGQISASSEPSLPYFNNIMTPMFAPGIMFNSIKSGLAVDYPIHTSSLTLENGGISNYANDYYIQKPFDERIPFEALLEPSTYLANIEIHCSDPHPSGNLSGSALWNGTGDIREYQLMMHNFLAETANFFLQNQNFSFISSKRSDELNINLVSGSVYGFNIRLYKSQNIASDREALSGEFYNSLLMTGSGVRETFTMYSRPSAFGPANRITSSIPSEVTSSYSNAGYNWAYTPSYYDGISEITFLFNCPDTRKYELQEIFNGGVFLENRIYGTSNNSYMGSSAANLATILNNNSDVGNIISLYDGTYTKEFLENNAKYDLREKDCSHALSSLNVRLGILKDVDLLDDDTSDTIKVAVDISSNTKSQIIIQPKWETPMFNFQSYSASSSVNLPLLGSQSAPRGMWHQYGQIETDPKKGVFMKLGKVQESFLANGWMKTLDIPFEDLSSNLGFSTEPVKLGKTASKKVIREAIVAVPFIEFTPNGKNVENQRRFFNISQQQISDAVRGIGPSSVVNMVNAMKRYVMPPMFNFLEDASATPVRMYMFEFKHVLDQEDLAAIWQNLPPKIMTEFQTKDYETNLEEVSIMHTFEKDELLSLASLEEINAGSVENVMKNLRWMVFKVKQKAVQNYYDKIVGETQKLVKTSPYSHNWPYDFFSLVELAKIDATVGFGGELISEDIIEATTQDIIDRINSFF